MKKQQSFKYPRPDFIFVISAQVWRDFIALREHHHGRIDSVAFHWDMTVREREQIMRRSLIGALHWRAIRRLAVEYAQWPFSAIEAGGELFCEAPVEVGEGWEATTIQRVYIGLPNEKGVQA